MTTQHTITVHHEAPDFEEPRHIQAYYKHTRRWYDIRSAEVSYAWGTDYTAWYDPQIGEVERPRRRYAVEPAGEGWAVYENLRRICVACHIPTLTDARAIEDIYERAAEGGEA